MILAIGVVVAQQAFGDLRRTFAAGEKDAYLMMPPEVACGGQTVQMLWSSDGRSLIVRRMAIDATAAEVAAGVLNPGSPPPRMRQQIVVWNAKSRQARTLLNVPAEATTVGEIEAMPGTDRLIFRFTERIRRTDGAPAQEREGVMMLAIGTGTLLRLSTASEQDAFFETVSVSPRRPIGALIRYERRKASARFFGPDGKPGIPVALPGRSPIQYDAQGFPGYVASTGAGGKGPLGFHRLDPVSGKKVSEVPFPPPTKMKDGTMLASPAQQAITMPGSRRPEADAPLTAVPFDSVSGGAGLKAPAVLLAVRGGKPDEAGVVTTDGVQPLLSPTNDAIAYVDQGNAMVRMLARVPRDAYDKAQADAAKREALSKGKQVGLGLIMFASDNDDMFPGQDADLRQKIGPYLKNDRLLDGFTYTFGGGDASKVEAPANTEMGYVTGPGGRAVVFVDGHVKWVPDAP